LFSNKKLMAIFFSIKKRNGIVGIFILVFLSIIFLQCSHSYQDGKRVYDHYCASCHMEDGTGLRGNIPPLAQSDYLEEHFDELPCIILLGLQEEIVVNGITYDQPMAGIAEISDFDIVLVINYINHSWGNDASYTDIREVRRNIKNCK